MMKSTMPVVMMLTLRLMGLRSEDSSLQPGPPHQCHIDAKIGSFRCLNKDITKMPTDIPKNTMFVEFKLTHLRSFTEKAFYNLHNLTIIVIKENCKLEQIHDFSFYNLSKLTEITITRSKHLVVIQRKAFWNLPRLQTLTISNTGLKNLPDFSWINPAVASDKFLLDLEDNIYLKEIPSNAFRGLGNGITVEMRLARNNINTVHSFAFNGTKLRSLHLMGNKNLSHIHRNAFLGAEGPIFLNISHTKIDFLPDSMLGSITTLVATSVPSLKRLPSLELFTRLKEATLTYPSHCCAFANFHMNRSSTRKLPQCDHPNISASFWRDHCQRQEKVKCLPTPDEFNPCEDIMGRTYLRVLIWVICVLAIVGNAVVLLVLLTSRYKLTVPRFLICHLAFADLCMGVYLMIIASVDIYTRSHYYNYSIDWQTGVGCRVAGFFTVFASELSIYTLTIITLERWHTITYAMQLERKLRLRHAAAMMAGGWVFAWLMALLPAVGLSSSYVKVSICLPMDVETVESQSYMVMVLLLNMVAFLGVCACYLCIYKTVHNPQALTPLTSAADTRLAKRMAVLIFTDFLCMAPISFFAISAALKWPLITVSNSKVLLVLFYPINSCANPFLYAFFTKAFKRDFFVLASHFGCFKTQARIYRTESSSVQTSVWVPSPRSSEGTIYSLVHVGHQH
ncbi:follicle-stimulating hormone receptor [Engraulis encrasicolus]|uniref:follicle-stimulating hormone receptor n=1 Tax=Engraulis encrasicolus TaxID=184585 RepID=UPI002FD54FBE